jgi:hypothetical protein
MRRTAATALATAVFATSTLAAPTLAAAAPDEPVPQIACGTVGPALCDAITQVTALLAPLQPLLDLSGPLLGELGTAASGLTALLQSGPDIPPKALLDATGALLRTVRSVTGPVLDLLRGAGIAVGPLESALTQLQDLAAAQLAPPATAAPTTTAPAAAPQPSAANNAPARSAGSSSATTFGGSAASTSGGSSRGLIGPAVPSAPAGGTLELAPLGVPAFVLDDAPPASRSGAGAAGEEQASAAVDTELVAPAATTTVIPEPADGSRATAVVVALSALLLAVGLLLDQVRKARLPIQL